VSSQFSKANSQSAHKVAMYPSSGWESVPVNLLLADLYLYWFVLAGELWPGTQTGGLLSGKGHVLSRKLGAMPSHS